MNKRILAAALALASAGAFAQTFASLPNITTGYNQNFDTLGSAAIPAQTNGSLGSFDSSLNGIFVARFNGTNGVGLGVTPNNGVSNSGAIFNYATDAAPNDRALGGLRSGGFGQPIVGLRIRNTTTAPISLVGINFAIEQFRNGGGVANTIGFSYALIDATTTDEAFATALTAGTGFRSDFLTSRLAGSTAPADRTSNDVVLPVGGGTAGVLDGNDPANRVALESEIDLGKSGLSLLPNQDIAFRFIESTTTGTGSGGFGVDNVRVVPEPASMAAMALGLSALVARRRRKSA